MPSGKTHDAITMALALPVAALSLAALDNVVGAAVLTLAFLFGGLMFGPDLDIVSKQSSRWGIFRVIWLPYRSFFKHRSRWSHGLIFGTFLRVIYLMGVLTVAAYLILLAWAAYSGGNSPGLGVFAKAWRAVGDLLIRDMRVNYAALAFIGMWIGAASHTFTDMAGSYIKTGRSGEFI